MAQKGHGGADQQGEGSLGGMGEYCILVKKTSVYLGGNKKILQKKSFPEPLIEWVY